MLFSNLSALATNRLNHIAVVATSMVDVMPPCIGFLPIMLISQVYDGSILPFVTGFAILSQISLTALV